MSDGETFLFINKNKSFSLSTGIMWVCVKVLLYTYLFFIIFLNIFFALPCSDPNLAAYTECAEHWKSVLIS